MDKKGVQKVKVRKKINIQVMRRNMKKEVSGVKVKKEKWRAHKERKVKVDKELRGMLWKIRVGEHKNVNDDEWDKMQKIFSKLFVEKYLINWLIIKWL